MSETSAEQLAEQIAELVEEVPNPNKILVGVHVKTSAELGPAAYDIAEFVNIIREQTQIDYAVEVHAGVNSENSAGTFRKTDAIGFSAAASGGDDGGDDTEEDEEIDAIN